MNLLVRAGTIGSGCTLTDTGCGCVLTYGDNLESGRECQPGARDVLARGRPGVGNCYDIGGDRLLLAFSPRTVRGVA
jgi:hypothetical protein